MSAAVDEFVAHFATLNIEDRAKLLAQVKMRAAEGTDLTILEPPIRTLGKYLSDPIEVPPTLVEPYIVVRGGITCTIGRAGKGKTVMNLNRILRWAAGKPMFDGWHDADGNALLAPTAPLKTLIIENEGAGGLFHRQIGIMLHAEDYLTDEERELAKENILIWGDGGYSGLKLDDEKKLAEVRRGCEIWQPDIVFVEPFRGLWQGEENSATDMTKVVDALVEIAADFKCGVMLAHHERKSGTGDDGEKMSAGRGSTVLEGAVTVMENFESAKGGEGRDLSWSKSRHGKAPNPVSMEWDADAWWYKWVPDSDLDEKFLDTIRDSPEAMNVAGLSETLNEPAAKIRKVAERLVTAGKLKKIASVPNAHGGGTTGVRYRMPADENFSGGLAI